MCHPWSEQVPWEAQIIEWGKLHLTELHILLQLFCISTHFVSQARTQTGKDAAYAV